TCTGAHGTEPKKSDYSSPAQGMFPMYKPAIRMTKIEEAGHYALHIFWSDGHNTGIYSYDHLRRICPCGECRAQAAAAL
ncbi:MAG: gamma-butyrobetaine hydroxylase-like domain-containing protein, partial [Bryobacteraceae bacterium]